MRCPGLFGQGQACIVIADAKQQYIVLAMMATKPDLMLILATFHELCQLSFHQCILQ